MNKLCIYYVEDNEGDRKLLALALKKQARVPFELHEANDGEAAIAVVNQAAAGARCHPDLIVLDLNLPKQSGLEVLAAIRKNPCLDAVRVMILTSSDAPDDQAQANALGISEYVRKPMHLNGFMELAVKLLSAAAGSFELAP